MKQIIIIGLFICILISPTVYCATSTSNSFNGNGLPEYPNEGYIFVSASDSGAIPCTPAGITSSTYDTSGNTVNYYVKSSISASVAVDYIGGGYYGYKVEGVSKKSGVTIHSQFGECGYISGNPWGTCSRTGTFTEDLNTITNYNFRAQYSAIPSGSPTGAYSVSDNIAVLITTNTTHQISGDTECVTEVSLYYNGNLVETNYSVGTNDHYTFKNLLNGGNYKLIFSDAHEYEFNPTSDTVYDYDACRYYTLNLLDNCANPLNNPYTTIFRNTDDLIYDGYDNPISLLIGTDVNIADCLDIIIWTCDGNIMYTDYAEEIEKDLYHPTIAWFLDVHVVDDNTGADISQAKVVKSQDCSIILPNIGYIFTNTGGHAIFGGLSNSGIGLTVEKDGYNSYSGSIGIGDCFNCQSEGAVVTIEMNSTTGESTEEFNNGTHNDSTADGTGGETLPDNHSWGCGVYFKNVDGNIVGSIQDTDAHVDMYYWIKGCNATLKFQSQIYTYWYTDQEYSVSNNTFEYRRIYNADFSDHTISYRGFIYNETCECNDIQILRVLNNTYEEETHYENLTSHCWIWDKLSGNEIDYRSDIMCVIYANSTNSTLLNITAYFMNGTNMVDSKVLNWADFVTGSPKWYYTWYPDYEYVSGYNYTLNITGFDGYQLDTDEVWTADIIGNTLTVNVKDNYGTPLQYSTVFIEGWGSIATGSNIYSEVTGLPDGNVQYKATKSGYIASSWDTVTLAGANEEVTCVLVAAADTSVIGQKMADAEIKSLFIPLMYILFIFMILGAFQYANK